jgi:hypothetical protein
MIKPLRADGHNEAIRHIPVTLLCDEADTGLRQEYSAQDENITGKDIIRTYQY